MLLLATLIGTTWTTQLSAQSCACKQSVNVSLGSDGTATVTAEMILTDATTCGGSATPKTVTVMITPTGSPIPGSPVVNCTHLGKTLYAKVDNGSNSCWSTLNVMDEQAPRITCPTGIMTMTCAQLTNFTPPFTDNCPIGATIAIVQEDITVNNCTGGTLSANVLKRIVRSYQATDAQGLKSAVCIITIDVITIPRLSDIAIPLPLINATALQCDGLYAKLANGNPSPVAIGVLTGSGVPTLGGIALYPDPDLNCNLAITFTDTKLPNIGCVTKIMRSWSIVEWSCLSRSIPAQVQMIEIVDSKGPTITGLRDITASTSNHTCEANVSFQTGILSDNCSPLSAITTTITIYPNGNYAVPGVFIPAASSPKTAKLPVGLHKAIYIVYDACHNATRDTINIEIEDNTPPVAIADEFATIGLTSDGTAWVPATVFDDGSYDECSLGQLLVRKMNTNNCGTCDTPTFHGFTLLGEYGTGANKHYYYLSSHQAMPKAAFKTAKAMGGYAVSYESLAEADWVRAQAFDKLPKGTNRLLVGLTDRIINNSFVWESGVRTTYTMPWANNEPDDSGVYVVQRPNGNWRTINNDEVPVYYVVEVTDPCGFNSAAKFCCSEVGVNQMVVFRAIDASGNYNETMVTAVIQDKLGPQITCPSNMTVSCDFVYDTRNLRKDFGWPTGRDNCSALTFTQDSTITVSSCRIGSITRIFTVTDAGGRTASCTQVITIAPSASQIYTGPTAAQWPRDTMVNGCGNPASFSPDILNSRPILTDGVCSLVGAQYEDEVYLFNNPSSPACFKIIRKWTVIDWCQPSRIPGQRYATFTHTQEIKVIDNIAPVIAAIPAAVSADTYDANCASGTITLTASASDVCTAILSNSYTIFPNNGTIGTTPVRATGNTITLTGNFPVGTHKIIYSFEDRCGNVSSREQLFSIVNKKAPIPNVFNGLAMGIMSIAPATGMAEIWASDFDNKSSHPCTKDLYFSFTPVTKNANGQLTGTPNLVFTCDDLGRQNVTIYIAILTAAGDVIQSSVETYIIIQDNNNVCDDDDADGRITVSGKLGTPENKDVTDVSVLLIGSELSAMTGNDGTFMFANTSKGSNYIVAPSKNDDAMNGVSTLDLVMIQRHILDVAKIESPYKLIAADVNKDGRITAADLIELRKLILGTTSQFTNNTSWRFVDKAYNFIDKSFAQGEAFPEVYTINNISAAMTTDFVAVKVGDIDGNVVANINDVKADFRSNSALALQTSYQEFTKGQTVTIPVTLRSNANVSGMQMTFNFDANSLNITNVAGASLKVTDANFGFAGRGNGLLTVSWNESMVKSLRAGDVLFNLTFVAKEDGNLGDAMNVSSDLTKAEAYSADGEIMNISWTITNRAAAGFALMQNVPNPFNTTTKVAFELPRAMDATLTVYDVAGRTVMTQSITGTKGSNEVIIDNNQFTAGVMYYTLTAGEYTATKKMVVIE